jgi:putative pantetheine hydrolase
MLPAGFRVGHATIDDDGWATGCTVILPPPGVVAAGEVRGGGPGTRESDLLSPATGAREVQAVLFSGGSAWGLGLADALMHRLWSDGRGYRTRLGHLIPLVPAAVVYDLGLGGEERPGTDAALEAYDGATTDPARGSVGAGTGCVVGKLLGAAAATKGGLGLATEVVDGATVTALAVVNAFGDVLAEDGSVLAGPVARRRLRAHADLLRAGERGLEPPSSREATTLVCVMTDAG